LTICLFRYSIPAGLPFRTRWFQPLRNGSGRLAICRSKGGVIYLISTKNIVHLFPFADNYRVKGGDKILGLIKDEIIERLNKAGEIVPEELYEKIAQVIVENNQSIEKEFPKVMENYLRDIQRRYR
jgi:hypothetical protein